LISRVGMLLFVALGQAPETPPADVLVFNDGTKITGVIVEEDDERVVLQIVVRGPKGETSIVGRNTYAKADIAEIRRMAADVREKERAKGEAASSRRAWEREDRLAAIDVRAAQVAGRDGLVAVGQLFDVHTTCDEVFGRAACDALQQAYEGYLRHFELRGKVAKVPVIILDGRAQYDEYLVHRYGGTVPGSLGLYHTKDNVIITYNCVQREEASRIRDAVLKEQEKIEEFRKKVREHEARVNEQVRAARAKAVRGAPDAKTREAELRRINLWKAEATRTLGGFRKIADAAIEQSRQVIRRNEFIVRNQNRAMFETLFHECFHAFARNHLFAGKEIPRWLNEGMACYFEMSVVEDGELIHGAPNPERKKLYRDAAARGRLPRLESVLRGDDFVVEHAGHIDRAIAAYAVSWALAHYLTTHMTRKQIDGYVTDVAAGADPADAFGRALGQPLPKIEQAVREHVASLK